MTQMWQTKRNTKWLL